MAVRAIAGYLVFREALQNAQFCLLDPIYGQEIKVFEEFVGRVFGDIPSRPSRILGIDVNGRLQVLRS